LNNNKQITINSPTSKPGFFTICLQHSLRFRFAIHNFMPRFAGHEVTGLHSHRQRKFRQGRQEYDFNHSIFTVVPLQCNVIISNDNFKNSITVNRPTSKSGFFTICLRYVFSLPQQNKSRQGQQTYNRNHSVFTFAPLQCNVIIPDDNFKK
jgi:hypothetical protein